MTNPQNYPGYQQPYSGSYPPHGQQMPPGQPVPPGYPMPGAQPMYNQPMPQTEGTATVSLILSIAGFFVCGLLALVGAILGGTALKKIRANPNQLQGEGIAKAGMIIGWIVFGLQFLALVAYIVIVFVLGVSSLQH